MPSSKVLFPDLVRGYARAEQAEESAEGSSGQKAQASSEGTALHYGLHPRLLGRLEAARPRGLGHHDVGVRPDQRPRQVLAHLLKLLGSEGNLFWSVWVHDWYLGTLVLEITTWSKPSLGTWRFR